MQVNFFTCLFSVTYVIKRWILHIFVGFIVSGTTHFNLLIVNDLVSFKGRGNLIILLTKSLYFH